MVLQSRKRCSRWNLIRRSFNWEFAHFVWNYIRGTHHDHPLISGYDSVIGRRPSCSRIHENRDRVIDRGDWSDGMKHHIQMCPREELLTGFEAKSSQFRLDQVRSLGHDISQAGMAQPRLPSDKIQRNKSVNNTYPFQYYILLDQDY
jgi:hypothetical protein